MRQPDLESLPLRDSKGKRRQFGWNGRDYRGPKGVPLKRWLASFVGCDFDKVWSEAKKKFSREELEIIDYYVAEDFVGYDEDGNPVDSTGHWVHWFYTDKGVLQKAPKVRFKQKQKSKEINYIQIDDQFFGLRTDGMWYRLYFKDVPQPIWRWKEETYYQNKTMYIKRNYAEVVYDVWLYEEVFYPDRSKWRNGTYCYKYAQCNKKELRIIKRCLKTQKDSQ